MAVCLACGFCIKQEIGRVRIEKEDDSSPDDVLHDHGIFISCACSGGRG